MASNTKVTETRRLLRRKKQGRKRKNREARKSTRSAAELFGDGAAEDQGGKIA